jgi:uncharacterized protein
LITRNKTIIEEFLGVYSTGDVDRIGEMLHADVRYWVAGTIPGISSTYNKSQMLALLKQVTGVYKQGALQITPSSMIGEGQRVAVEAESHAELHNGRVYNNFYHFVFEIEDGKIKLVKEYLDTQHVYDTFIAD